MQCDGSRANAAATLCVTAGGFDGLATGSAKRNNLFAEGFAVHDNRTVLRTEAEPNESLGELLRSRALASSTQLLIGQAAAGVALNAAVLMWHPERWGIATAAAATIALHALWSIAVQRSTRDDEGAERGNDTREEPGAAPSAAATPFGRHGAWRLIRRVSAVGASAAALTLLWFVCMMLLGRLIS